MLNEYADFADVFLQKLAAELPEHGISNHAIELVDDWQPPYVPIYSQRSKELETLKAYIEKKPGQRLHQAFQVPRRSTYPLRLKARG